MIITCEQEYGTKRLSMTCVSEREVEIPGLFHQLFHGLERRIGRILQRFSNTTRPQPLLAPYLV